jgi:hypothetical protein
MDLISQMDIRIGFTYGITDRLNLGVSRFKRFENLMGEAKFRALEQTNTGSMPISLTLWGNAAYSPRVNPEFTKSVYRFTYATQAVLARKFSSSLSFELGAVLRASEPCVDGLRE